MAYGRIADAPNAINVAIGGDGNIDYSAMLSAYDLAPPLTPFALDGAGVNNETAGLRTGAGAYVVKRYRTLAGAAALAYEHRLLARLTGAGLPFAVPAPLTARDGRTLARDGDEWLALFPLLPGAPPDPRDPQAAEQVGAALAALHAALARVPAEPHPSLRPYGDLDHVHPDVPEPEALPVADAAWWRGEIRELRAFAGGPYRALPWQLTHGDFAPGNTLFTGGALTAVLDFEMAQPDARAIDVAAGLYFTLRPCEDPPAWDAGRAFTRGYARHIELTQAEIDAIPALMRLRNTVSVIWHVGQDRRLARGPGRGAWRVTKARRTAAWLARTGDRLWDSVATIAAGRLYDAP